MDSSIINIGVQDNVIDLFEGQFAVPDGILYNSYVIKDEKIAVIDSVDNSYTQQWLANLSQALCGNEPNYLIVQHMEPDHSSGIADLLTSYPNIIVVATAIALGMIEKFYHVKPSNTVTVKEGDTLNLGIHQLSFVLAPMVHWPEVMMTYDSTAKCLFSADAFGKFGVFCKDGCQRADEDSDDICDWLDEARRYYYGIVGKYGKQVKNILNKVSKLDIKAIYPLHGKVITTDIGKYIDTYTRWADGGSEQTAVLIVYTSIYGNTKRAVLELQSMLKSSNIDCHIVDIARATDIYSVVADSFKCSHLVVATTTYNMGVFPCMDSYLRLLANRNYLHRYVGIIENGSWAPVAAKSITELLTEQQQYLQPTVTISSSLDEHSSNQLARLAETIATSIN